MMQPSQVVTIRISTADVMSCVDLVDKAGYATAGMSLAAVVRLGVSVAMQSLRNAAVVPERDGFEYSSMIEPFKKVQHGLKVEVGTAISRGLQANHAADILPKAVIQPPPADPITSARLVRQYNERAEQLKMRRDHDPLNYSEQDQEELDSLFDKLSQLGAL